MVADPKEKYLDFFIHYASVTKSILKGMDLCLLYELTIRSIIHWFDTNSKCDMKERYLMPINQR